MRFLRFASVSDEYAKRHTLLRYNQFILSPGSRSAPKSDIPHGPFFHNH